MGINIIETMKKLNVDLVFPPIDTTYRISFTGTLINGREKDFEIKDNIIIKQLINDVNPK